MCIRDRGRLAEEIFDDLAFPKHDDDFNILSDYIETHGDFTLPMSVFDDLYLSLIHISEPTRLALISYAVFCLKKTSRSPRD
ncbi:hypothetical protein JMUB7536_27640 [Staphylococcus aureus]